MSHPSVLRPVQPNDLDALVILCAEHAAFERSEFVLDGQAERLHTALFNPPPRLWVWVVEVDQRLDGFAAVSLEYSTWRARNYLHLDCIYLRDGLRGQGWGSKLFETVVEQAKSLGCDEMQWQTPPWNEKAIAFYDAKGAVNQAKLRFSFDIRRAKDPARDR